MRFERFFIAPINAYQYISRMLPASCRYYPSCSEFAKQQFQFNAPHLALMQSSLRILRCNKLFEGGIDYPIVKYKKPKLLSLCTSVYPINYWIVPKDKNNFYVIKVFLG